MRKKNTSAYVAKCSSVLLLLFQRGKSPHVGTSLVDRPLSFLLAFFGGFLSPYCAVLPSLLCNQQLLTDQLLYSASENIPGIIRGAVEQQQRSDS